MLRRTVFLFQHHNEFERSQARKRAKVLYHKDGSFNWRGFFAVLLVEKWRPGLLFLGFVGFFLAYTKLIVYLETARDAQERKTDAERMEWLRASGKVKSEKYIVNKRRQIDDPDMGLPVPSFTGKTEGRASRLFADEGASTGQDHEERR